MRNKDEIAGPFLIYEDQGRKIIILIHGIFSFLKYPQFFKEPIFLLRFPFILVISSFFITMIETYNRLKQRQELLKEDMRELEVLAEIAQSIDRNKNLTDFLFNLTKTLCNKLLIRRCMAILVDDHEEMARMVSSDDSPEKGPFVFDFKKYPLLKESLRKELGEFVGRSSVGQGKCFRVCSKKNARFISGKELGDPLFACQHPLSETDPSRGIFSVSFIPDHGYGHK